MNSPFADNDGIVGRLMMAKPDEKTSFVYTIWFDYTRKMFSQIQDGDLLAVPNFALEKDGKIKYSILKLTNVLPWHFALGGSEQDLKGYPGFVDESAKNIVVSWREQETESLEDTTKIVCTAVPTNLEFKDVSDVENAKVSGKSAMPMLGEEVKLLSTKMTMKVINGNINPEKEDIIRIGHLIRNSEVDVYLRVEDLIKTHFGIFGFTGVGKSNLLSTLITKLLTESKDNIKIVLFDLMDEYTGLLIDQLLREDIDTNIICLGEKTLSGPTFDYLNSKDPNLFDNAVKIYLRNLLLPKGLRGAVNLSYK